MKARLVSPNASSARQQAMKAGVTSNACETRAARMIHEPTDSLPLHLTPRQLEVLSMLCEGLPNKLISRQLDISGATVKVHVGCILRELGVSSRLQAVVSASRLGLVNESTRDVPEQEASSSLARNPGVFHMLVDGIMGARIDAYQGGS